MIKMWILMKKYVLCLFLLKNYLVLAFSLHPFLPQVVKSVLEGPQVRRTSYKTALLLLLLNFLSFGWNCPKLRACISNNIPIYSKKNPNSDYFRVYCGSRDSCTEFSSSFSHVLFIFLLFPLSARFFVKYKFLQFCPIVILGPIRPESGQKSVAKKVWPESVARKRRWKQS